MMNIYWRWLKLVFTCGLGHHAPYTLQELPDNTIMVECPRCHDGYYEHHKIPGKRIRLQPDYWDVARGMYDKEIQP
jgi:hypothetical protein